ncbi:MAG: UDP-N-acetylmuramate dehydrogenase [Oscillospiraceae bacterium]|nr:UDP-N-acetylmuramate dehydrogenase [Oscillospiraceae bacterium]
MDNEIIQKLKSIDGCTVSINEPLAPHTTFGIGGSAAVFAEVTAAAAPAAIALMTQTSTPFEVLGKGSNVLIADKMLDKVFLHFGRDMADIEVQGTTLVCGAGASLSAACIKARDEGLSGLEFAYGIPASIGGAVYMNAGAYGGEIKDILLYADITDLDGNIHRMDAKELGLSYRHSELMYNTLFCISAAFTLTRGDKSAIDANMQELMGRRRDKQPLEYKSAGSTFKRPEGAYAAALIEQCGLKGFSVGGAEVSTKHSGFVINKGGASFDDVMGVIAHVQQVVKEKTGFYLEIEPEIMQ